MGALIDFYGEQLPDPPAAQAIRELGRYREVLGGVFAGTDSAPIYAQPSILAGIVYNLERAAIDPLASPEMAAALRRTAKRLRTRFPL
jgi:hypothetical protein